MHKRLTTLDRSVIGASLAIIAGWGCSGSPSSSGPSDGGDTSVGGASAGGVPSIGGTGTGGSRAGGGAPTAGGGAPTGGALATGGKASLGGAPTGGVPATGGVVATGGIVATGGKTSGGAPPTGGMPATGGSILGNGGTLNTGGVNAGGMTAPTGGKSAMGGSSAGTGGKATGGASALGTGGKGTGGAATGGGTGTSQCPAGTVKAGNSTVTITSSGASRSFIVHIPTGYTGSSPLPVVFDFHPLGGTGSSQQSASHWDTKCDSVGCIAVFPNSASNGGNGWNVGYCCQGAQQNKVDDVQFTRDMLKWLEANACVDPKRVYASGCSNGGGMTYILACDAADVIAAVAPVDFRCITGTEPSNPTSLTPTNNTACTCTLPRPISVMAFDEGGDNGIVPYNGGNTSVAADCPPGGTCKTFYFPSAQLNVDTWAHFDSCSGTATTDSTNSICKTYTSCGSNTQVSLCTESGGHCGSYGTAKIVDTAWTMFQKQSLP